MTNYILMIILMILLIRTVACAPSIFNRKKHKQLSYERAKQNKHIKESHKKPMLIIALILEAILCLFFAGLGLKFNTPVMIGLSSVKITTEVIDTVTFFPIAFSTNPSDFKYRRWWWVFETVLNLIYYILAIYMLAKGC